MNKVKLNISQQIFDQYPETSIGYISVDNLSMLNESNVIDSMTYLPQQGINKYELTIQNLADFPTISNWRNVYRNCGVKPKTYKSSIESLIRRFIQNKYNSIIPSVDFYNYISARYILPIGGYNFLKIKDSLTLRYANEKDNFTPLSGSKDISITNQHIVYADETENDSVVCWLWNHKDSKRTMLTKEVNKALFIFDCVNRNDVEKLNKMLLFFKKSLEEAKVKILNQGILDISNTYVYLE